MTDTQKESDKQPAENLKISHLLAQAQQLVAELNPDAHISITPDSHLERDLGLDSMARVELFARLEKMTRQTPDENLAMQASTLSEVLDSFSTSPTVRHSHQKRASGDSEDLLLLSSSPGKSPDSTTGGKSIQEWLYAFYFFTIFTVLGILAWVLLILDPFETSRRRISRYLVRLLFWLARIPVSVQGHEWLDPQKPVIFAINHSSYLDGILVAAVLEVPFHTVVKSELASSFLIRIMLKRFGVEFVDRFNPHRSANDLQRITQRAKSGCSLVFFPEGTFIDAPGLQAFRMGAFVAAGESGLAVVPVAFKGIRTILQGDRWFPRRGEIEVTIRPPVVPAGSEWQDNIGLRETVRQEILSWCGEPDALMKQEPVRAATSQPTH